MVDLRIRAREAEFVRGEPARIGTDLLCPLATRCFIHYVPRHFMIVDADPLAEFSSQQRAGWHGEDFAGKIPQSHLDATGCPYEVVRGTIRTGAREVLRSGTQFRVESVDLERIFPRQPRVDR